MPYKTLIETYAKEFFSRAVLCKMGKGIDELATIDMSDQEADKEADKKKKEADKKKKEADEKEAEAKKKKKANDAAAAITQPLAGPTAPKADELV